MKLSLVIFIAITVLAVLAALVFGDRLKMEKFTDSKKKAVLTWYMADWCGHCQKMKGEWADLEAKIDKTKVDVKIVKDSDKGAQQILQQKGVEGFPTIHLEKDGEIYNYNGPRTSANILAFINKTLAQ